MKMAVEVLYRKRAEKKKKAAETEAAGRQAKEEN